MKLDIDFVRSQFDQLNDDAEFVFACNAGGSYVCNQVNTVLEHYNHHTPVQHLLALFAVGVGWRSDGSRL